jgi:hypothetical protein
VCGSCTCYRIVILGLTLGKPEDDIYGLAMRVAPPM